MNPKLEMNKLEQRILLGYEGSVQATLFCLTATIILLMVSHQQNKIIKPYWIKK